MAEGTRDRIVEAAVALFAAHGFKATTVAAIEAASGLSPGSGALYKHFPSKQAVLGAAVEAQEARLREIDALLEGWPADVGTTDEGVARAAMAAMAGLSLDELDRSKHLQQVVLRDAAAVAEVAPGAVEAWVHGTYRRAADQLARRASALGVDATAGGVDLEAQAFISMAPLVLSRLVEWLTGDPPLHLARERLVAAWVEAQLASERAWPRLPGDAPDPTPTPPSTPAPTPASTPDRSEEPPP